MVTPNLYIIWMARYPGWQEVHTTIDLDFLLLIFKIIHNIELIS